jgi:flagellum-specific peptidoglycan hydrolase FlgJ
MTKAEFFKKYGSFAQASATGSGLSPLLILSQAYIESGGGESKLSKDYYNFFGVKADKSWTGKKVLMKTREQKPTGESYYINAYFRKYDNPGQSFQDHIKFLKTNPRYSKAGLFSYPDNYEKQADTLQKSGYATDINYSNLLKAVAKNFKDLNVPKTTFLFLPLLFLSYLLFK